MNPKKSALSSVRIWWLAIAGGTMMIALCVSAMLSPLFFDPRNILNILKQYGPLLVICSAVFIPFSRGYVDCSPFGLGSFSGIIYACLCLYLGIPVAGSIIITLLICTCLGALHGLLALVFRRKNVLFSAAATLCLNAFYRGLSYIISSGKPIRIIDYKFPSSVPVYFILPIILLTGIFALLSFVCEGNRAFNDIYEKEDKRNSNPFLPFLFSGLLSGCAGILITNRLYTGTSTSFSFNPSYFLVLLLAGMFIPNVKKIKAHAFLGYLSIIIAAFTVQIISNIVNLIGINSDYQMIIFAFLSIILVIVNVIFGSKAAKLNCDPAPAASESQPNDYHSAQSQFNPYAQAQHIQQPVQEPTPFTDPYAMLEKLTRLYQAGRISKEEYQYRRQQIISKM